MKTRKVISHEQRLTSAKNRHFSSCFKAKERRRINIEERNKRIGLSEEKVKELEGSNIHFFQSMLMSYGETFNFYWDPNKTKKEKREESISGFRFTPYHVNKNMWFLYTNKLEDSPEVNMDQDLIEQPLRWFLNSIWVIGSEIVRDPRSYTVLFGRKLL